MLCVLWECRIGQATPGLGSCRVDTRCTGFFMHTSLVRHKSSSPLAVFELSNNNFPPVGLHLGLRSSCADLHAPIPPSGPAHSLPAYPSVSIKDTMPGSAPLCWGGVSGQQYGRCAGRHPHHPLHHRSATTTLPHRDGRSPQPRRWAKTLTPPRRSTTAASSPTTTMWLKVRRRQNLYVTNCVFKCAHMWVCIYVLDFCGVCLW